jgi:hypothetical protein
LKCPQWSSGLWCEMPDARFSSQNESEAREGEFWRLTFEKPLVILWGYNLRILRG